MKRVLVTMGLAMAIFWLAPDLAHALAPDAGSLAAGQLAPQSQSQSQGPTSSSSPQTQTQQQSQQLPQTQQQSQTQTQALGAGTTTSKKSSYSKCLSLTKAAIAAHKTTVKYPADTVSYSDFKRMVEQLYSNSVASSPIFRDKYGFEAFTLVKTRYSIPLATTSVTTASLGYFLSKAKVKSTEAKVKKIAKTAKTKKTKAKKIKYIHDYLVKHTAYATASARWSRITDDLAHSSYGVLLKHRGYCHGYVVAFVRIAQAAGISNASYQLVTIAGSGGVGNHALTKIGSRYYDATWDDPMTIRGADRGTKAKPVYTYYNKTKAQMRRLGYQF